MSGDPRKKGKSSEGPTNLWTITNTGLATSYTWLTSWDGSSRKLTISLRSYSSLAPSGKENTWVVASTTSTDTAMSPCMMIAYVSKSCYSLVMESQYNYSKQMNVETVPVLIFFIISISHSSLAVAICPDRDITLIESLYSPSSTCWAPSINSLVEE